MFYFSQLISHISERRMCFFLGLSTPILSMFLYIVINTTGSVFDKITSISAAFAASAVIFAYFDFRHRKKHEMSLSVIEQLNFFRTEILLIHEQLTDMIVLDNKDFKFNSIKLPGVISNFSYAWIYKNHMDIVKAQTVLSKNEKVRPLIFELINSMEEFSWNVILHDTSDNPALKVVQDSFVQFVESFSHQILICRADAQDQFEGIRKLYLSWSTEVSRATADEKIEKIVKETKGL